MKIGLPLVLLVVGCSQPVENKTSSTPSSPLVTALVSGRVFDYRLGGLGGVTVQIGKFSATTDANGVYTIADVVSGDYTPRNLPDIHVMNLEEFRKAAVTTDSGTADVPPLSVASNFDAVTYTYALAVEKIMVAPDTASISGMAEQYIDGAVAGTPLAQGAALVLQFSYDGGTNWFDLGETTVADGTGAFVFSKVPAWDYFFWNKDVTTADSRIIYVTDKSVDHAKATNWREGSIATTNHSLFAPGGVTTALTAPVKFPISTKAALALVSTNVQTVNGAENTAFSPSTPLTLSFNNALSSFRPSITKLVRDADRSLVDTTVAISGSTLTVTPQSTLDGGTRYLLTYEVSDGVSTLAQTAGLAFETSGSGPPAVTDLALDVNAKYIASGGVSSGYNAGEPTVYVKFTKAPGVSYGAQYRLASEGSWQDSALDFQGTDSLGISHAVFALDYSTDWTWDSGNTLQVRVVARRAVRAVGDPVGADSYSSPVSIQDSRGPLGGTLLGYASTGFGSSVTVSPTVISYQTESSSGLLKIQVRLDPLTRGSTTYREALSLPTLSGLDQTVFGSPEIQLSPDRTLGTILLPVLSGKYFGNQTFTLNVADGAANGYTPMSVRLQAVATPTPSVVATTSSGLTVSWASVPLATGYTVTLYSTSSESSRLGTVTGLGAGTNLITQYSNTENTPVSLTPGASYFLTVTATNRGGESLPSSRLKAVLPPAAPSGLLAVPGAGQVTLSWNPVANATEYYIYWVQGSGPVQLVANKRITGITTTSYTHTSLASGSAMRYVVVATNLSAAGTPQESSASTEIGTIVQ